MLTDRISMRDADTGWRCLNPLEPLSTLCPSAREPDWANDRGSQMGVGVSQDPCRSYFAGRQAGYHHHHRALCLARLNWMLTGRLSTQTDDRWIEDDAFCTSTLLVSMYSFQIGAT